VLPGFEGNASDHLPVLATLRRGREPCDLAAVSAATLLRMAQALAPGEPVPPDRKDLADMLLALILSKSAV
jgi:hypothetical protein